MDSFSRSFPALFRKRVKGRLEYINRAPLHIYLSPFSIPQIWYFVDLHRVACNLYCEGERGH